MGFFSKKKKDEDLSTLSEKDIQKKLYGALRSENVTEPKPYVPADREAAAPSTIVTDNEEQAPELFTELVEVQESSYTESEIEEPANEVQEQEVEAEQSSGPVLSDDPKWTETEKKVISDYPADQPTSIYKPPVSTKEKESKGRGFLKKCITFFGEATNLFLGGVVGIIMLFDLRKLRVRRLFYLALIAGFVALLFYGIHFLNVQRETAMKEGAGTSSVSASTEEQKATVPTSTAPEVSGAKTEESSPSSTIPVESKKEESAAPVEKKEVAPPQPEKPVVPVNVAEVKPYVIQIATYAFRDDAERVAKKLQESKINAFVRPLNRPSGKLYFCVFLGRYASFSDANKGLASFKKNKAAKPFQDSFVRTLK